MAKTKKKIIFRIMLFTFVLAVILVIAAFLGIITNGNRPTISVDYGEKINELTKPVNYAPNNNAAPIILKALKSYNEIDLPHVMHGNMLITTNTIDSKRLKHIKESIKSNETSLELLCKTALKPYCWKKIPLNTSLVNNYLPHKDWSTLTDLVNALIWRGKLREKNNISNALNDYMLAYKTSAYIELAHLSLIHKKREMILKNLTYTILTNDIHPDLLKKTQDALEGQKHEDISKHIEILRFISFDYIQRRFTDDGEGDGEIITSKFSSFYSEEWDSFLQDVDDYRKHKELARKHDGRNVTIKKLNKTLDTAKELSQLTPWEVFNNKKSSYKDILKKIGGQNEFAHGYLSYDSFFQGYHESICHQQAIISILAVNRFKSVKGHLPASLEKLVEDGYMKKIPMDPYSDKSLIYKLTENGFILYSIGRDFTDNGGQCPEYESWSQTKKSSDYIFWPVTPKENETPKNTVIDPYFTDPNYGIDPYFTDPNYDPNNLIY